MHDDQEVHAAVLCDQDLSESCSQEEVQGAAGDQSQPGG